MSLFLLRATELPCFVRLHLAVFVLFWYVDCTLCHPDIIDFLTSVECVEGRFDTYGTQGKDFTSNLLMGGPTSKGFGKANLSPRTRALLEEVALSEQVPSLWSISAEAGHS